MHISSCHVILFLIDLLMHVSKLLKMSFHELVRHVEMQTVQTEQRQYPRQTKTAQRLDCAALSLGLIVPLIGFVVSLTVAVATIIQLGE